ncbi:MAG: spore coat protein CotJB [Oscillospiraceae bacterium]|nr:spore coat protein CotJB [Oscillospiraceae bacterium]
MNPNMKTNIPQNSKTSRNSNNNKSNSSSNSKNISEKEQPQKSNRTQALKDVQCLDFALHEAALFLDVNPNDKKALKYFEEIRVLVKEARQKFESQFGPLTIDSKFNAKDGENFSWVDSPWPWEYSESTGNNSNRSNQANIRRG